MHFVNYIHTHDALTILNHKYTGILESLVTHNYIDIIEKILIRIKELDDQPHSPRFAGDTEYNNKDINCTIHKLVRALLSNNNQSKDTSNTSNESSNESLEDTPEEDAPKEPLTYDQISVNNEISLNKQKIMKLICNYIDHLSAHYWFGEIIERANSKHSYDYYNCEMIFTPTEDIMIFGELFKSLVDIPNMSESVKVFVLDMMIKDSDVLISLFTNKFIKIALIEKAINNHDYEDLGRNFNYIGRYGECGLLELTTFFIDVSHVPNDLLNFLIMYGIFDYSTCETLHIKHHQKVSRYLTGSILSIRNEFASNISQWIDNNINTIYQ
jgi:hypothetical protein